MLSMLAVSTADILTVGVLQSQASAKVMPVQTPAPEFLKSVQLVSRPGPMKLMANPLVAAKVASSGG